jgi:hypothetical protein
MARAKKPKVQIKREKTSLAYRIYIDGMYMGAGLTMAFAREGAKRMLVIHEKTMRRNQPSKIHGDGSAVDFSSWSQHFTSQQKTFSRDGQVSSHHQTFLRYRNGRRFF